MFETNRELRSHFFLQHSTSGIVKYYNRSLEELMGKKDLKEIRGPLMTTIR